MLLPTDVLDRFDMEQNYDDEDDAVNFTDLNIELDEAERHLEMELERGVFPIVEQDYEAAWQNLEWNNYSNAFDVDADEEGVHFCFISFSYFPSSLFAFLRSFLFLCELLFPDFLDHPPAVTIPRNISNALQLVDGAQANSEYTYFNPKLLDKWAGPLHWKYEKGGLLCYF